MILYINCCPRKESRTNELAGALLEKLGPCEEINLYNADLMPLNEERLNLRTELIEKGDFSHPIFDPAKQFAKADIIVMAAPFWDLSFPSMLKIYLENIYVTGITSRYNEMGIPEGLCRAEKLYYVSTSGGPMDKSFGYDYIKTLVQGCFGIKETELIKAEMLDIEGNNPGEIIDAAKRSIGKTVK